MRYDAFKHSDPLTLKVADFLRAAIVQGESKPGERLNELLISSKLGISRSPIREALRILESENLVEIHSRKGAFVRNLSVKEVEEVYQVISSIERTAVRLAIDHLNAERERELKSMVVELEEHLKSNDFSKFMDFSMRLHHFIIEASENRLLSKIYHYLQPQRERLRRVIDMDKADMSKSLKEHLAISKALLKRDREKAELLLSKHIDEGTQRILGKLLKSEEP